LPVTVVVRALQRQIASLRQFLPQPFKPLSPETIKALTANPNGEASICQNGEALSQCSNQHQRLIPIIVTAARDDEDEMKR
jgi:hypothetical protein